MEAGQEHSAQDQQDQTELQGVATQSSSSFASCVYQNFMQNKTDIFMLVFLSISIPSCDVYTDLALTIDLALRDEVWYAISLLVPQLATTLLTDVLWWHLEDAEHRMWSWLLVTLQARPQVYDARILWKILKGEE